MAPVTEIEKKIADCNYPLKVEKKCSGDCIQVKKEFNCNYSEIKPDTWLKEQTDSCADAVECQSKFESLVCDSSGFNPIKNLDLMEVYCTKFEAKHIISNASLKAAYEASQAQEKALEDGVKSALKRIEHGKRVIALLLVRNSSKNLSKGQVKQMVSTYAEIKGLLETGSLETAKDEINLITPDGTIVTEGDKSALVSEIDKFLNQ